MMEDQQIPVKKGNGMEHRHYTHKKWYKISAYSFAAIAVGCILITVHTTRSISQRTKDIRYAFYVASEFEQEHIAVNPISIYKIIECATPLIDKYFTKHEFGLNDILAIGYVESCYRPETVGKAGEVGLFQILKPGESLTRLKKNKEYDFFDIPLNVEMCVEMLKQKYDHEKLGKHDYQSTIIAYNGSYTYWPKFIRIKKIVDKASHRMNNELNL